MQWWFLDICFGSVGDGGGEFGPSEHSIRMVDARLLGKGRGEPEQEKLREGKGEHALDLAILPALSLCVEVWWTECSVCSQEADN